MATFRSFTQKQSRDRIKPAGVAVLEYFFSTHHQQPTQSEADQLLSQVQAIPGCETFNGEKLTNWFKRRIQKYSSFLSLSAEAIQHLIVLSENHSNPSDELIWTWAILLKTNVDDIKAWLQYHKEQQESAEPVQMLMPTPTNSTSPEPFMKWETPPSVEHEQSECKVMEADINKVLLDALTYASQEDKAVPPNRSPVDAQEFECMFAPYEQKMLRILNGLS